MTRRGADPQRPTSARPLQCEGRLALAASPSAAVAVGHPAATTALLEPLEPWQPVRDLPWARRVCRQQDSSLLMNSVASSRRGTRRTRFLRALTHHQEDSTRGLLGLSRRGSMARPAPRRSLRQHGLALALSAPGALDLQLLRETSGPLRVPQDGECPRPWRLLRVPELVWEDEFRCRRRPQRLAAQRRLAGRSRRGASAQ
mmetsp:Transcript_73652/g.159359  ORF Transcript_73652/g.159359 Transcript_73652/m.159359 type:complete len:201 (-) Transcript_73652:368-970(-)